VVYILPFLHATAATAVACLSHHNSACPSIHLCHMGGSVKSSAS